MRVIAGVHRGRRLLGPSGPAIRPTSDRVKEALFSIVGDRIVGARVLDLYAGTGALGIEALSRGAAHVTFIEEDVSAGRLLQANLQRCRRVGTPDVHVSATRVESYLRRGRRPHPFDIVLADPPYAETVDVVHVLALAPAETFAPRALLILEHAKKTLIPPTMGVFHLARRYEYGDTALSLFQRPEEPSVSL
ncbi:MAG: 16S rRNA (guanine(966)-N(2))-methyltransferase RsmD [Nitrospiraceae bacterium]